MRIDFSICLACALISGACFAADERGGSKSRSGGFSEPETKAVKETSEKIEKLEHELRKEKIKLEKIKERSESHGGKDSGVNQVNPCNETPPPSWCKDV
jgi:hypothetical protein